MPVDGSAGRTHIPAGSFARIAPALICAVVAVVAAGLAWPGYATHDTLFVTEDAVRGVFTTYHPLLNGLLVRALAVPVESFALYMVLQILVCVVLMYRSLTLVADADRARWTALAGAVLWAVTLSTVLYLGVLWKDVLSAYCLAYVAALAYWVRTRGVGRIGRFDAVLLAIAMILILGLRHGMAYNLLAVPLVIGWRRFRGHRSFWMPWIIALCVFIALAALGRSSLVKNDESHYLRLKVGAVSQPFLSIISNQNGYTTDDPGYDAALASSVFGHEYAKAFTPDYFRNQVVMTDARALSRAYRAILLRTPRLCLMNLAQCVAGRIEMGLATLQPSTSYGGMKFYDLGLADDCAKVSGVSTAQCFLLSEYSRGQRPALSARMARKIVESWVERRGGVQNVLVWNMVPAVLLALLSLVVMRPGHALWAVSVFVLAQMVLPFATAMANDFRYYYFLSLYWAVFAPVAVVLAWRAVRERRQRSTGDG